MHYAKENSLTAIDTRTITSFLALSGLAMILPFYLHIQWLTGPMVNAILILALFLVGIRTALLLCMIPSMMALAGGLIPPILAPALPFIMFSNMLYVLTIDYFYQRFSSDTQGYIIGSSIGSIVKYLFLYFSIDLVADLIIKQELALKIAQLFSYTQLFTALSGAMLAFVILKMIKRI